MAMSLSSSSQVVREWLQEYKTLTPGELKTYAATIRNQPELTSALCTVLTDRNVTNETLEPICHQLFEFYRSNQEVELLRFTLDLIPTLVTSYLLAISRNNKKKCASMEVLLLSIYNLEIVDDDGKPKVRTFTIPTLAEPSIYHEPPSLASLALTESSLMRYHSDKPITLTIGPMPQIENVNAQNRMTVLSYILNIYNAEIALLSAHSLQAMCTMCSILCRSGFEHLGLRTGEEESQGGGGSSHQQRGSRSKVGFMDEPRVSVSSGFLIECLTGMYFAMFNGNATEGLQALEHVHMRASYELYADVLLVTNAVRNSLQYNPSGQPEDGPMGIAIALSPTQTANPAFLKDAITNASFRTKRLPEDIEPEDGEEVDDDLDDLTSRGGGSKLKKEERRRSSSASQAVVDLDNSSSSMSTTMDNLRKRLRFRRGSSSLPVKEDIEVRDGSSLEDNPPHYDDVVDSSSSLRTEDSKAPSSQFQLPKLQLAKPLKSIMKTGRSSSRGGKDDTSSSSSSSKRERAAHESPRHSASVTTALSSSFNNGDIPGTGSVYVEVQRGGRSTTVDNIEMGSMDSGAAQRRTTSFSDDFISSPSAAGGLSSASAPGCIGADGSNHSTGSSAATKPPPLSRTSISTSHSTSRELNNGSTAGNGNGNAPSSSSSHSLNTHL